MKVLARRVKQDGRVLNLGVVDTNGAALGSVLGQDFVRPIQNEKRTVQTCNAVEPLVSFRASDDVIAVDALQNHSGHQNLKTVEV